MELYTGRPADCGGRLEREVRTYDFRNKIDAVLGVLICKNLFLCNRQRTNHYLLLMPGDKPFRTKELSKQLGVARLSFANEEDMLELLDLQPGAVSVMGLMNDKEQRVRLIVDGDVLRQEYFGCHPCVNTSSMKLRTKDMADVYLPATGHEMTVVELTGQD